MGLNNIFTNIADALREKTGTTTSIPASDFPEMILNISDVLQLKFLSHDWLSRNLSGTLSDDTVNCIGQYTFISTNIESVTFNNASYISGYAFENCSALTFASFPMCSEIMEHAFGYCYSLSFVYLPNCTYLSNGAFDRCSALISINLPALTSSLYQTFMYCINLKTANLPLCQYVGNSAFTGCKKLYSISAPMCSSIGYNTFGNCDSLNTISFPNCTYINSRAFEWCRSLTSCYFLGSSVPVLSNTTAFNYTPFYYSSYTGSFGSIYVLPSMVDSFKTATNWAQFSSRITAYTA